MSQTLSPSVTLSLGLTFPPSLLAIAEEVIE